MIPITRLNRTTGEISGRVTWRNWAQLPPPSIWAASYRLLGTDWSPARKITTTLPIVQVLIRISDGLERFGSQTQLRRGRPNVVRTMLNRPIVGLNIHIQRMTFATAG